MTPWVWDGNTPLHEWIYDEKERPKIITDEFGLTHKEGTEPTENITTWVFEEGSFRPAAKLTDEKKYSIIADYLGTPVQMYDGKGKLTWEARLDIYGKVGTFAGSSLSDCPFRYQGQYHDAETDLYYNRFRYYDPDDGIYLSKDPIGLAGNNPTIYGYVKDVNNWVDAFGLWVKFTSGYVYREGSATPKNFTPRPSKDTTTGLSTSLEKPASGKFQTIDISKLEGTGLEAINDQGTHVFIRPENDPDFKNLEEWADTRETGGNKYTKALQNAKVSCP
jgi:RHS repeat-associated protein